MANWILHSYEKIGFAEHEQKLIIDRLIMRVDSDGDGALDLKEFTHLFEHATNKIVLMNKARSMFQEIDTNNSGFIERDELGVLADRLLALQRYDERSAGSEPFTARERSQMIERVLRMADGLGEGRIDLYSFSQIYDSLSEQMGMCARARSKFREFDLNEDGFLEGDELPRLLGRYCNPFPALNNFILMFV